ncbi:predicted GPI-anchored protein 23 [Sorghum bicolor]|uniref:predicted GPI-anchored protein 23 n=1 Tax=Sorghum bicolor TaxID=4558 RepID=UPI000B4251CE|nr:predicted GPI-anchored protein 23 [Sorghum bicolor]|eukprot:XP_021306647.1 predicted GPI-anchored protein 23 [Sorghum bicolor]
MAWRAGLGTVSAARVRGLDVRLPTARSARARAARPGQEGARGPLVGAAGRRGGPARARGPPRFVASAARAAAELGAVRLGPEARTTEFGQEVWLATGLVGAAAVPHTYFRRRALSAFSSARLQDGDGLVWVVNHATADAQGSGRGGGGGTGNAYGSGYGSGSGYASSSSYDAGNTYSSPGPISPGYGSPGPINVDGPISVADGGSFTSASGAATTTEFISRGG